MSSTRKLYVRIWGLPAHEVREFRLFRPAQQFTIESNTTLVIYTAVLYQAFKRVRDYG